MNDEPRFLTLRDRLEHDRRAVQRLPLRLPQGEAVSDTTRPLSRLDYSVCAYVPAPRNGAYGEWVCGRKRWHLGPHRFINYIIPRTSRRYRVVTWLDEKKGWYGTNSLPRRTRYKPKGSWWTGYPEKGIRPGQGVRPGDSAGPDAHVVEFS